MLNSRQQPWKLCEQCLDWCGVPNAGDGNNGQATNSVVSFRRTPSGRVLQALPALIAEKVWELIECLAGNVHLSAGM
jgi:hypothetical protein